MAESSKQPLLASEFKPLDTATSRRKFPITPGYLALAIVALMAAVVLGYLFAARAVIFRLDPENAEISVSGLSFHIGDNFLLLPGDHILSANAQGYFPLEQPVTVSDQSTQEIDIALEPLPGNLEVQSELDDIQVSIDDQPAGTAPGLLEGISRGSHKLTFSKHRYFDLQQEVDIEGLGRTQSIEISLEPAWGQMEFNTVPQGVELFVDEQLIGVTPLSTEILETGSMVSLIAPGYKTWQKQVSVKAGSSEAYPEIKLTVADGKLVISSSPSGASITIDDDFKGVTPLTVPLSPLSAHRVELFLEGYRKGVRRVDIEPEQEKTLAVDLSPIIGQIELSVSPEDAQVLVNGRVSGAGSQTLRLTAREHSVSIRKPGFETQNIKVTPRPDHPQSLQISLLTIQQAYWATRPPRINSPIGTDLKLFRPKIDFTLGAPRREPGRRANEAQRSVSLERPFYLGTHEISNDDFRRWKEEHSSGSIQGHTLDMANQPVANVTWQDAALFCNWLSRREGLPVFYIETNNLVTGFIPDSHGYRMPTEAEWAWAAKINADGTTQIFPWNTNSYPPDQTVGNYADKSASKFLNFTLSGYDDGFPVSAPTGKFKANGKGLYDLSGNVAEWVNDYYEIRPRRDESELDPLGPVSGNRHVIRGSSWQMGSRSELRMSYRDAGTDGRMDLGFRIARYVDKKDVNL